jgi:hypothetical protein
MERQFVTTRGNATHSAINPNDAYSCKSIQNCNNPHQSEPQSSSSDEGHRQRHRGGLTISSSYISRAVRASICTEKGLQFEEKDETHFWFAPNLLPCGFEFGEIVFGAFDRIFQNFVRWSKTHFDMRKEGR